MRARCGLRRRAKWVRSWRTAASKGSTEPAERESMTPPSIVVRTKVARACGSTVRGRRGERAAVLAVGGEDAAAVAGEDGEDALDGVGGGGEGGVDDDGVEGVEVAGEDLAEECLFAVEEVVEAAGVDVGVGEEVGHGGAGVAALPEEVAGGVDEPVAGGRGGWHRDFC